MFPYGKYEDPLPSDHPLRPGRGMADGEQQRVDDTGLYIAGDHRTHGGVPVV